MPKISIITPTYNSSQFIKRTIESVLGQTYKNWEYLIIDDHSTDNTVDLINEFIKKDPRIKLYNTPKNSGGPALPKNIGIGNAIGEYMAFLDHDDEWLPEKLEKQIEVFNNSDKNTALVCCYANIKNNDKNKIISINNNLYKGNIINKLMNNNFIYSCSSVMIRSSILKDVGHFDANLKISDDWDMWIRISEKGYLFNFASEYLFNYFVHNKNACYGKNSDDKKNEFIFLYHKHKKLFLKYGEYRTGYYYFILKKFQLSRKYYARFIFSKKSNYMEKLKSLTYIILSFFPTSETLVKKIWIKIK